MLQHAQDALAFLERVVGEPAILVGRSQGSLAAIKLAAAAPERVIAVVLEDPPLYVAEDGLRDFKRFFEVTARQAGMSVEALLEAGFPQFRAETLSKLDPAVLEQVLDGSVLEGYEVEKYLAAIECPVLLLQGQRERGSAIYEGEVDRVLPLMANVAHVQIEGAGHLIHIDQPERFIEVVREFLEAVE